MVQQSKSVPPVVDPSYPVDYGKRRTPPNYVCHECFAASCKLWREHNTFLSHQRLLCARCAGEQAKVDISDINADGYLTSELIGGKTDQIGFFLPAVPTIANDTYWGYTSVPGAGCEWWRRLPTLPPPA